MHLSLTRFVGIDLAKRTMEICILCDGMDSQRFSGVKTDDIGRARLAALLNKTDIVAMEACSIAFLLARFLKQSVGCTVYILNPGKLQMIWKSTRKTDKEDARKIASFIMRNPEEELPLVSLPDEKEEELRNLVSMKQFLTKVRTSLINRLHAIYLQAGITGIKKSNLASPGKRQDQIALLSNPTHLLIASSIEKELSITDEQITTFKDRIDAIVSESELTPYIMSIPGVGPGLAAAFIAFIGDGKRFSKASEVANYVGLVPKVDCSGDTNHYGRILRSGNRALRSIILQSAWALVRSNNGGRLQEKYFALSQRMSKTKSAVAIARRIVTLMWVLVKKREFYADVTADELRRKFRHHKLNLLGWEALMTP